MAGVRLVKPSGAQLSGPTTSISKTIQQMPKNGILVIGLSGDDRNKVSVGPNDPGAALIEEIGADSRSSVRWFQLLAKRAGNVMVEARDAGGAVADYFQLAMPTSPAITLPKASSPMDFTIEPDDRAHPGQINLKVYTLAEEADFIEKKLRAVGYSIYLFGFHAYCDGIAVPVMVPESYVDFTVNKAAPIDNTIYPDRGAAEAALRAAGPAAGGARAFAYYRGAGGALVVPTLFSPATTPRTIQTLLTARALLADEVQKELVTLAISLVGGMVLKSVMTRIVKIGSSTAEPPAAEPPPIRTPTRIPPEAEAAARLVPPGKRGARVLVVGPETEAEFDYALQVNARGGKATAVNPQTTAASGKYVAKGGDYVQGRVESLPEKAEFDIIREDFPYPTGNYVDIPAAKARLSRLKPGGSWVVVTEKPDFADALEAAAKTQGAAVTRRELPPFHEGVPVSGHPKDPSRIAVVITKKY